MQVFSERLPILIVPDRCLTISNCVRWRDSKVLNKHAVEAGNSELEECY